MGAAGGELTGAFGKGFVAGASLAETSKSSKLDKDLVELWAGKVSTFTALELRRLATKTRITIVPMRRTSPRSRYFP